MSRSTIQVTPSLYEYMLSVSLREPPLLEQLRRETEVMPHASMQISPEQGQLMGLLVRMLAAKRTLEVGVFTGYSSLSVALALPEDGRIVACDVSEEYTAVARRYWQAAGVEHKIDLRLAPALETLSQLVDDPSNHGTFDFAFIDADKVNYQAYFDASLTLLRPGGVIAVDNVLWGGDVADPQVIDEDTQAIRQFNSTLHTDQRVDISLAPIGDGLFLACKR